MDKQVGKKGLGNNSVLFQKILLHPTSFSRQLSTSYGRLGYTYNTRGIVRLEIHSQQPLQYCSSQSVQLLFSKEAHFISSGEGEREKRGKRGKRNRLRSREDFPSISQSINMGHAVCCSVYILAVNSWLAAAEAIGLYYCAVGILVYTTTMHVVYEDPAELEASRYYIYTRSTQLYYNPVVLFPLPLLFCTAQGNCSGARSSRSNSRQLY